MSVRVWLFGFLLLAAAVSCASSPKPAPADPAPRTYAELDPKMVAMYVRSQLSKVKDCWERSLKTTPTLAGTIVMHWTIAADGVARNGSVESNTMQASPLPDCLQTLIEEWRFPNPTHATVEVSFPFRFLPYDPSGDARSGGQQTPR
jgi:hypothetical protein